MEKEADGSGGILQGAVQGVRVSENRRRIVGEDGTLRPLHVDDLIHAANSWDGDEIYYGHDVGGQCPFSVGQCMVPNFHNEVYCMDPWYSVELHAWMSLLRRIP